jgi:hypothetical protein
MSKKKTIVEYRGIGEDADRMHRDHEVQMARGDCYSAAKYAVELHKMLEQVSEFEGLDGWVQEKLTLACDYLRTVHEYMEHNMNHAHEEPEHEIFELAEAEQRFNDLLEEKDPVWNKGTPMPKDYTCGCGIHVHPSVRKPGAIHIPDCPYAKKQDVTEGLGAYDNDKGIKHTRGSLLAKLEALPRGSDDFEWNRNRAIQHLKQGNTLRAKYYMMLMKRGEQGVAEGSKKIPASNKPVDPKYLYVSLDDVPPKKPRGYKQYDPRSDFPFDPFLKKDVTEDHADQPRKIIKKNGKPVGEIGIDSESSPGVGQWYMKCYSLGIDNSGYDSMEEALAELKYCLKQDVTEGSEERTQNRLRQMITDYEQRAKKTKNEIKKQHYMRMADDLRLKLKTRDDQDDLDEGVIPMHLAPLAAKGAATAYDQGLDYLNLGTVAAGALALGANYAWNKEYGKSYRSISDRLSDLRRKKRMLQHDIEHARTKRDKEIAQAELDNLSYLKALSRNDESVFNETMSGAIASSMGQMNRPKNKVGTLFGGSFGQNDNPFKDALGKKPKNKVIRRK